MDLTIEGLRESLELGEPFDFNAEINIRDPWDEDRDASRLRVSVYRELLYHDLLVTVATFQRLEMPIKAARNILFDPGWLLIDIMEETFYYTPGGMTSEEIENMFFQHWILLQAAGLITPRSFQGHRIRPRYEQSWDAVLRSFVYVDADLRALAGRIRRFASTQRGNQRG